VIVDGWKLKLAIETALPVSADAAAGGAADGAAADGAAEAAPGVAGVDVLEQAAIASMTATARAANRVWCMLSAPDVVVLPGWPSRSGGMRRPVDERGGFRGQ
jgi:hypothetical protein